jgi:hypothetical protein
MKIEKRIHQVYKEWQRARDAGINFPQLIGKWQYIYSSDTGKISLIELKDYLYLKDGFAIWEIYCLEGNLFEDVERFGSKDDAEIKIKKYFNL